MFVTRTKYIQAKRSGVIQCPVSSNNPKQSTPATTVNHYSRPPLAQYTSVLHRTMTTNWMRTIAIPAIWGKCLHIFLLPNIGILTGANPAHTKYSSAFVMALFKVEMRAIIAFTNITAPHGCFIYCVEILNAWFFIHEQTNRKNCSNFALFRQLLYYVAAYSEIQNPMKCVYVLF